MTRRNFLATGLAASAAASTLAMDTPKPPVKLGIDLFSLRNQKWSAFEYLDYCAQRKVNVVHFSEVRFLGGLDPAHLRQVRQHAEPLGIEVEIGMMSICPGSKMFKPQEGTAPEQLSRMIDAAQVVGSKIVRCVLGSAEDRRGGQIDARIAETAGVLHQVRSKAMDTGIKIAIENHAGDMQARELRTLVEEGGKDFVGVCLDSGNPLWTLEDPHLTLETLHPYVLTSHVRDSAVWQTPEGVAVTWVQMGRGNVDIDSYLHKFAELCPGKPLSLESIVFGPRKLPTRNPSFWDAYRKTPAWEYERFMEIAERGKPYQNEPWETPDEAARERAALDESLAHTKKVLGM
jgi:3-oxoisoapionate decarboxylase